MRWYSGNDERSRMKFRLVNRVGATSCCSWLSSLTRQMLRYCLKICSLPSKPLQYFIIIHTFHLTIVNTCNCNNKTANNEESMNPLAGVWSHSTFCEQVVKCTVRKQRIIFIVQYRVQELLIESLASILYRWVSYFPLHSFHIAEKNIYGTNGSKLCTALHITTRNLQLPLQQLRWTQSVLPE
jgi:hypothetical protein